MSWEAFIIIIIIIIIIIMSTGTMTWRRVFIVCNM